VARKKRPVKRTRSPRKAKRSPMRGSKRFKTITGRTLYASPQRYPRLYEWIISVGDSL
jgi:hypothetical protein